jgi:hypothetical protein
MRIIIAELLLAVQKVDLMLQTLSIGAWVIICMDNQLLMMVPRHLLAMAAAICKSLNARQNARMNKQLLLWMLLLRFFPFDLHYIYFLLLLSSELARLLGECYGQHV